MTTTNKYIEKSLYKANGIIAEITSISEKLYNVRISKSAGKKNIVFTVFKDSIDNKFFLKDRVKIKFRIDCRYVEKQGKWYNSLFICDIQYWRVNDEKLTREEKMNEYLEKKTIESQSIKSINQFNN